MDRLCLLLHPEVQRGFLKGVHTRGPYHCKCGALLAGHKCTTN